MSYGIKNYEKRRHYRNVNRECYKFYLPLCIEWTKSGEGKKTAQEKLFNEILSSWELWNTMGWEQAEKWISNRKCILEHNWNEINEP